MLYVLCNNGAHNTLGEHLLESICTCISHIISLHTITISTLIAYLQPKIFAAGIHLKKWLPLPFAFIVGVNIEAVKELVNFLDEKKQSHMHLNHQ